MAWLLRQGEVLASVDLVDTLSSGVRELRGHEGAGGAVIVRRARPSHTFGAPFPLDVAFLDSGNVVLGVVRVASRRPLVPCRNAVCVLAAREGAFDRWGLGRGDALEVDV